MDVFLSCKSVSDPAVFSTRSISILINIGLLLNGNFSRHKCVAVSFNVCSVISKRKQETGQSRTIGKFRF